MVFKVKNVKKRAIARENRLTLKGVRL